MPNEVEISRNPSSLATDVVGRESVKDEGDEEKAGGRV